MNPFLLMLSMAATIAAATLAHAAPEPVAPHASLQRAQIDRKVDAAIRSGKFARDMRKLDTCEPYQDEKRIIHRAHNGVIRRYESAGGSDDAYVTKRFYYDAGGIIALGVITANAANGAQYRYRLVFDAQGRKVSERRTHIKGPGYPFPDVWPEQEIVRQPRDAFAADNPCPTGAQPMQK